MKYAKLWLSSPDVFDGYYIELCERKGKLDFQYDSIWFLTPEHCKYWAARNGVTKIEII